MMRNLDLKESRPRIKNTIKVNEESHHCFTNYVVAKKLDPEYWNYTEPELDKVLSKFWFEVCTVGEHHKIGSLENLCSGLNRMQYSKGHEYDIVHGDPFRKSRNNLM